MLFQPKREKLILHFHAIEKFIGLYAIFFLLLVPVGLLAAISCQVGTLAFTSLFLFGSGFYGTFAAALSSNLFSILFFACYWTFLLLGPFLSKNGYQHSHTYALSRRRKKIAYSPMNFSIAWKCSINFSLLGWNNKI